MIVNCGHDERGKYSGGQAGDQTGQEWAVIPWYSRPWDTVIRHPDRKVREKIAELARAAAINDKIGYDQAQRTTFWMQLQKVGYDPAKITAMCEADCSAGVAAIVKATGYLIGIKALQNVSKDMYTGNEKKILGNAGFKALMDTCYTGSDKYLLPGDILLCTGHHTAINLDKGEKATEDNIKYPVGWNRDKRGWWYADTEYSYYRSCWQLINHHWYYFGDDGYILTGCQEISGKRYYFEASGDLEGALYRTDHNGAQYVWEIG